MAAKKLSKCKRYVDMWAMPGFHPSNVEFLQQLRSADTQHFTKQMNTVGTVSEKSPNSGSWEKTHLIGVRTDVWRPDQHEMKETLKRIKAQRRQELKKSIKRAGRLNSEQSEFLQQQLGNDAIMKLHSEEIEKRRLVLKLFKSTGKRTRWCGTIEEMTTTEIHNSIGSRRSLLTMAVMLPGHDAVTFIQQNHRTFRQPSIFTFAFYDERTMWHVSLKRRWISLGADFDVAANGQSLGVLDGRLIGFGSDSYVNLNGHELSGDTQFVDLMTLFTASVGYHRAMHRSVKRRVQAVESGKGHLHVIEDEELRLRHNGRRAA